MNKKKLVGVIRKIVKEEVKKMGGQLKKQIVREVLNEVKGGQGPSQSGDEMVDNIMQRRRQSEIGRSAQRQAGSGQQNGGVSQQADQMLNAHNRQGGQGQQQINAQQDPGQSFKQMMDQQYFGGGQGQGQPQQQRQGGGRQNPVQETMNQHSAPLDENLTNRWKDLNEKMKNKKGHSPAAGAGGAQGPSPSQVSQSWKPGMFNDDQTLSDDAKQRLTEEKKRQRQPKRSKAKKAEINRDKNGQ
jgi:hypothetical protein